jgi:hypothetical protein
VGFKYINEHILLLLDWLSEKFPEECKGVHVNVMNGYKAVGNGDIGGFGVYLNADDQIADDSEE